MTNFRDSELRLRQTCERAMARIAQSEGLLIAPSESEASVLHRLCDDAFGAALSYPGEMIRQSSLAYCLKAPRMLIQMLRWFHPHLLEDTRPLRILYLGSRSDEMLDEGRWFYAAFRLEGLAPRDIEITAVGPELGKVDEHAGGVSEQYLPRSVPTAVVASAHCTLDEAVNTGAVDPEWDDAYDLVVMHNPGFIAETGTWYEDYAWNDLAGFGNVPIMGTSFDPVDLSFDRLGLATCGRIIDRAHWYTAAHLIPGIEHNRFRNRLFWGGVAWSTRLDPEITEGGVSPSQLDAIKKRRSLQDILDRGMSPLAAAVSWVWTCPMQMSDSGESILVSDEIRVDVADGQLTAFGRQLEATELSRCVAGKDKWKDRMSLLGELSKELAVRLGMDGG